MKIVKLLWITTFLGCFVLIVLSYASMPLEVVLSTDFSTGEVFSIGREAYFYMMIGILLLISVLMNLTGWGLRGLPRHLLIVPNKKNWFYNQSTRKELYQKLREWVRGFSVIFNIFFAAAIGIIQSINSESTFAVEWIIYLSGFMAIGWLIFYFFLFSQQPEELQEANA